MRTTIHNNRYRVPSACVALALLAGLVSVGTAGCGAPPPLKTASAGGYKVMARTSGEYFQVYNGSAWTTHLVKGVNIGASSPGHYFGELAISRRDYARWFDQIAAMNANTLLSYTLMMPEFYQQLDEYNRTNPSKKLWLIQQIWPRDQGAASDLFNQKNIDEYMNEIKLGIRALSGNENIGERRGLAWGRYTVDVLPYVLGVLVGRELTSQEVKDTNAKHPDQVTFQGDVIRTTATANPTEVWVARTGQEVADNLAKAGWAAPVGYVSWPTLDPLFHPTEQTPGVPRNREVDDSQVLDPRHLMAGPRSVCGFFGTFQIYPYYPEFIYRQPSYASYRDEKGVLRYGGYLKEFKAVVPGYPALVGEYGLPTSITSAHHEPEGFSQGDIEEQTQGMELQRIFRTIVREGYAGGLVFEWADEWAKKNWVTVAYMVPFDRHVIWHNIIDPEESFGIMAYDKSPPGKMGVLWSNPLTGAGSGPITILQAGSDAACLYINLVMSGSAGLVPGRSDGTALSIGISLLGPGHGTVSFPIPGSPKATVGMEYMLTLSGKDGGMLLSRPDYSRGSSHFWADPATDSTFEHMTFISNRAQISADGTYFPPITTDQGIWKYGDFNPSSPQFNSLGCWYVDKDGVVRIRIPWNIINISDPSSNRVILDSARDYPPGPEGMRSMPIDTITTIKVPGINLFAVLTRNGSVVDYGPRKADGSGFKERPPSYTWGRWESPRTHERLKKSYPYLQSLYGEFDASVIPPR